MPSLHLPDSSSSLKNTSEREKRYSVKLRKQIVKQCLEQYKVKVSDNSKNKEVTGSDEEKDTVNDKNANIETELIKKINNKTITWNFKKDCDCGVSHNCLKCLLQNLQEENEFLKSRIEVYKEDEIKFKRNEKNFKRTIDKLEKRFNKRDVAFENKAKIAFDHFLSPNQVDILLKKKTKVRWTEEEFTKAFNILQFSKRFYVYLKDTLNYPLPGFSTLKKWISDVSLKIEKDCPSEDVSDPALNCENRPLDHSINSENQPSNNSIHSENQPSIHSIHSENQPSNHSMHSENRPLDRPKLYENISSNYPVHSNHHIQSDIQTFDQVLSSDHSINSGNQSFTHLLHSEIQPLHHSIHSDNHPSNHLLHSEIRPTDQHLHSENQPSTYLLQPAIQPADQPIHSDFNQHSENLPFHMQSKNCLLDHCANPQSDLAPEHLPLEEHSNESLNLGDQQIKMFCSKAHFPSSNVIDTENLSSKGKNSRTKLNPKEKRSPTISNKTFQFHLSHKNFFNKLILNRLRRKVCKPTKPKRFICSTCNKGFDLNGALKRHIKTHLLENPWTCDVCDEIFSSKFYLDRHITIHKKADRFLCDICDQSFVKKINFKDHYLKHKNIQPQNVSNNPLNTEQCINENTSGEQCSNNSSKLKPYLCHICNNLFEAKGDLKIHLEICKAERKNSIKNAKEEKVIYVCESCNKEFKNRQYFQSHLLKHTNQKLFLCEICDKTFSAQHCLKRHMILHDNSENKVQFLCNVCNKAFSQKRYLTQHMQTHLNEKPYACELCPKRFAQNSTLKKHVETHKNECYNNQSYLPQGTIFQ